MNTVFTFRRIGVLLTIFLSAVNYSFGTDYTFKFTNKYTFLGTAFEDSYKLSYNTSNPSQLVFTQTTINGTKTLINETGVNARIVNRDFLQENRYLIWHRDADSGILFTKDGKDVCIMYYYTSTSGWPDDIGIFYWDAKGKRENETFHLPDRKYYTPEMKESVRKFKAMQSEIARTSSQSSSANKPNPTPKPAPAPTPDNKSCTAYVVNPRYVIKEPGADALFPFQIFYDVTMSKPVERYDFLCLQNADNGTLYSDPTSGSQYYAQSSSHEPLLTMDLQREQMPAATPSKPVRLRVWIFMSTPGNKEWIGRFNTPVYIWDGTYLRREK